MTNFGLFDHSAHNDVLVSLIQGFPYGTKPGEEERVSLPNASYTKGNYDVSARPGSFHRTNCVVTFKIDKPTGMTSIWKTETSCKSGGFLQQPRKHLKQVQRGAPGAVEL